MGAAAPSSSASASWPTCSAFGACSTASRTASAAASRSGLLSAGRCVRPRILLLDEPLSALDDETRREMHSLLPPCGGEPGVTTLHVTHSLSEAKKLADRVLLLENGGIREMPLTEPRALGGEGLG